MKNLRIISLAALAVALFSASAARAAPFAWVFNTVPNCTSPCTQTPSTLVKIDVRTQQQVAAIKLTSNVPGLYPFSIAASPDGRWVAISGNFYAAAAFNADLILLDTRSGAVDYVSDPGLDASSFKDIAFSPDGSRMYLSYDGNGGGFYVVDPNNPKFNQFVNVAKVGSSSYPSRLYVGPRGIRALAQDYNYSLPFNLVDLGTGDVRSLNPGGPAPISTPKSGMTTDIGVAPDGRYYGNVPDASTPQFLRFTLGTDRASDQFATLPLAKTCAGRAVAVSPDGKRAYMSDGDCTAGPGLLAFDLATFTQLASISLPSRSTAVEVTPDSRYVYALLPDTSQMAVVDAASGTLVKTIALTDYNGQPLAAGSLYGRGDMMGGGPPASSVVFDPADPQTVYTGTHGSGVFVSHDGGTTWTAANSGLVDPVITALAVASNGAVYAGTGSSGVFKSIDKGASWQRMNVGLGNLNVRSLTVSPVDGQVIFAGTDGGGSVYKSTDGGQTWKAINDGLVQ